MPAAGSVTFVDVVEVAAPSLQLPPTRHNRTVAPVIGANCEPGSVQLNVRPALGDHTGPVSAASPTGATGAWLSTSTLTAGADADWLPPASVATPVTENVPSGQVAVS